jgi:hypothetical protein
MTDPTSDDVRDDYILQERLSGKSARTISKQLRCTVGEINASLDRTLPTIDNNARRRYVALDLNRLDELLKVFFARAIEKADAQAGLLVVKVLERRSLLLGLDSPQKLDIIQVQAQQTPSRHERIKAAIWAIARPGQQPPEDDDGAVDAPSLPDDTKTSH